MIENRHRCVNIDFGDHNLIKLYSTHDFYMCRSIMIDASIDASIEERTILPSTTIDRPSIDRNQY